ncbi:hypothetical protein LCGC14_0452150 [marine sediment metagenome]|uniref:Uncharacterized protein n=1 Tax=marine sediment metagenome TaxID=412755 RepID=A0A0F9SMW6_9ZZZZ
MSTKGFEQHKREYLRGKLSKLKKEQIAFFNRIYVGIDEIPEDKMDFAACQIENTILKNEKGVL